MNRITTVWMSTSLAIRLGVAFGSITILLSTVLGGVSGNLAEAQLEQDISQDLTQIAYQMTDRLDQDMFERYREIQIIAGLEPFRTAQTSDAEKQRILEKIQETYPNYSWIGFANREGIIQVSVQGLLEGASVSQRDWFIRSRENLYVGDVREALLLAKLLPNPNGSPLRFVDIASPVYNNQGNFQGVLGAHLSWQWAEEVKQRILSSPAAQGKEIFIVNRSNTVLLGPEKWQGKTLDLESLRLARLQEEGYVVEHWPDGRRYLVGFVKSQGYRSYPGLGWTILVKEPTATAFMPARALHRRILLGGFVVGGGFASLGWLAASLITKPLLQIANAADQIRRGNRQVKLPQADGQSEIARLSQALTQLLSGLFDQEQSLQRSQQQLQQIVDGIEDPLLLREIGTGRLIFLNTGCAKLYDRLQEVKKVPVAWLQHVHPDDRPWVTQKMEAEIQGTSFFDDEYRVVEPDGSIHWFWDRSYPIYDETGEIYRYVIIKRDITELKHASEMLKTLMAGTAAVTGTAFFEKLVQHLAIALNADHVFVAEKVGDQLQTLAFWSKGQLRPNLTYSPENTPCAFILSDGTYYCQAQITQVFPTSPYLAQLNAEGHVGVALINASGEVLGILCAISETPLCDRTDYITILQIFANRTTAELERQYSATELQESEARFRLLAENGKDLVCLHDSSGKFLYLSPSCQSLLGFEPQELVGMHPYRYCHPDYRPLARLQFQELFSEGGASPIVYRARRKDGSYIWLETLFKMIHSSQDNSYCFQTSSRDITEKVRAQQQMEHDATHDSLTGLPNRSLLLERIELAIERAKRHDGFYFALLFVDLDRFKVVNDSLGHRVGDELLQTIAQKLASMVRGVDLVARLGGDEFVLLIEEIDGPEAAIRLAEQIITNFKTALSLDEQDIVLSASVGIVFGTPDYTQEMNLLRDADIAMHSAKQQGGSCYVVFNQEMHQQVLQRLVIENELRRALEQQEFTLRYQPIVCLESSRLVGFEALVRWQHPEKGFISPAEFIPIAEDTGLIVPLGNWILQESCRQMVCWQTQFPAAAGLKISVNLSVKQLRETDLVAQVEQILQTTGLPGQCLALEITESMLMEDIRLINQRLEQLNDLAVQISIDDFGTGFSSLSYLHRLAVNNLKIDRSFISNLFESDRNLNITETIIKLSQQLGLATIAEGIETLEQLQQLKSFGCNLGQGYLFNAPITSDAAIALIRESDLIRAL